MAAQGIGIVTDDKIGKFRSRLPESEWKLRHDCLVAVGLRRSPCRGGKSEARQRVVSAMEAEVVAVAGLGRAVARAVTVARGNEGSLGTACVCGHAVEEHGHDPEYPGSTSCAECRDCIAYEREG